MPAFIFDGENDPDTDGVRFAHIDPSHEVPPAHVALTFTELSVLPPSRSCTLLLPFVTVYDWLLPFADDEYV